MGAPEIVRIRILFRRTSEDENGSLLRRYRQISLPQSGEPRPKSLVCLEIGGKARDGMTIPDRSELTGQANTDKIIISSQKPNRQHFFERGKNISARRKRILPPQNQKPSSTADIIVHALQIIVAEILIRCEVIEYNNIEIFQLFQEKRIDGKRNKAELPGGYARVVFGGAKENKRNQIDGGIPLQGHSKKAVIPGGSTRDSENPNFVSANLKRNFNAIVRLYQFSLLNRGLQGQHQTAHIAGSESEPDFLVGRVSADIHRLCANNATIPRKGDRELLPHKPMDQERYLETNFFSLKGEAGSPDIVQGYISKLPGRPESKSQNGGYLSHILWRPTVAHRVPAI